MIDTEKLEQMMIMFRVRDDPRAEILLNTTPEKIIDSNLTNGQIFELVGNYEVRSNGNLEDIFNMMIVPLSRQIFISCFGFSVVSREAVNSIRDFLYDDFVGEGKPKLLEICAGLGLWSKVLSDVADVKCTSLFKSNVLGLKTWIEVEESDRNEAIKKYNDVDCIFGSWLDTSVDMKEVRADKIIIIGEDHDGCTFYLPYDGEIIDKEVRHTGYKLVKTIEIPRWEAMNDVIRCYRRIR